MQHTAISKSWLVDRKRRLLGSSLFGRLTRATMWCIVGSLAAQGLTVIGSLLVARMLGRASFGELGMIQNSVNALGVFAGLGMGLTATKHVAEFRDTAPDRAAAVVRQARQTALIAGTIMSLTFGLLAPLLASTMMRAPQLTPGLRIAAALLALNALNGVQNGVLAGFEEFKVMAGLNLVRGVIYVPLVLLGARDYKVVGVVAGMVLTAALCCILSGLAIRVRCPRVHKQTLIDRWDWVLLWQFSVPAFLGSLLYAPADWIASLLLVRSPAGGYSELGLFNAANQWGRAITLLPNMIGQAVLPILSNLIATRQMVGYRRVLWTNCALTLVIGSSAGLLISTCAKPIMKAYGAHFAAGWPVLVVLSFTFVFSAIAVPLGQALQSTGKMWHGFTLNIIWVFTLIATSYYLVAWGAYGLALAYSIALFIHAITSGAYVVMLLPDAVPRPLANVAYFARRCFLTAAKKRLP